MQKDLSGLSLVRLVSTRGQLDEPERLAAAENAAMETFRAHRVNPGEAFADYERWRRGEGSEFSTVSVWRIATAAAVGRVNRGRMSDFNYRLELTD